MLYLHGVLPQRSPSSDFGENQLSRGLISLSLLLSSHLRIFQHPRVRSFTWYYPGFNLLKSRSPPLRVYCPRLIAHFALGFPSLPFQRNLGSPRTITRRLIMQKAGRHRAHLNSVLMGIPNFQSPNPKHISAGVLSLVIGPSHLAGGQMGPAPTHCMHSVAGTISLP